MNNSKYRYLHLDGEMGGREVTYSLLTMYFGVTDMDFKPLGELYLKVKPDDGIYIVSGQGLRVNKIDLAKHDLEAITYKQASSILYTFLNEHAANGRRLIPVGHGVRGDIKHIIGHKLLSEGSWNQFCTYHYLDTSVILQFLRACNKMPMECDGSVGELAKVLRIKVQGELHDGKVDAVTTAAILQKFIQLGMGDVFIMPGVDESDLPSFAGKGITGTIKI